jgi:hypothetical protein
MGRLLVLADALYWIAGSIIVIGGFFVFLGSMIKHLWDRAVQRKAESMRHVYIHNTNVDIYNIFFQSTGSTSQTAALPKSGSLRELEVSVDATRLEPLLVRLLHPDEVSGPISPKEVAESWTDRELEAAMDLCGRAILAGVSDEMKKRCDAGIGVLRDAINIKAGKGF